MQLADAGRLRSRATLATGAQQERRDGAFFGEDHAVKPIVGLGELGEKIGSCEVERAAVHQHAANRRAVAAQELGRRVVDDVGAMVKRTEQIGRGEGRIHQ